MNAVLQLLYTYDRDVERVYVLAVVLAAVSFVNLFARLFSSPRRGSSTSSASSSDRASYRLFVVSSESEFAVARLWLFKTVKTLMPVVAGVLAKVSLFQFLFCFHFPVFSLSFFFSCFCCCWGGIVNGFLFAHLNLSKLETTSAWCSESFSCPIHAFPLFVYMYRILSISR